MFKYIKYNMFTPAQPFMSNSKKTLLGSTTLITAPKKSILGSWGCGLHIYIYINDIPCLVYVPTKLDTLQETNISPKNGILKMIFLSPRWDMLIPWRVFAGFNVGEIHQPQ